MKQIIAIIILVSLLIGLILSINALDRAMMSETADTETNEDIENINNSTNHRIIINDCEPIILENILLSIYHSVFEWQKYSGDFKEEQLFFLYEQCKKYEIPMELMLSIICTESGFRSDAKAPTSSASGYCQILKSTAEWIYEEKLHYGSYDVNNHVEIMTTDWRLNIEISCRLMYSLYYNNGKSWETAVKYYYSKTDPNNIKYLNTVNSKMIELFDIEISDLT
jgi:hypothetical protein